MSNVKVSLCAALAFSSLVSVGERAQAQPVMSTNQTFSFMSGDVYGPDPASLYNPNGDPTVTSPASDTLIGAGNHLLIAYGPDNGEVDFNIPNYNMVGDAKSITLTITYMDLTEMTGVNGFVDEPGMTLAQGSSQGLGGIGFSSSLGGVSPTTTRTDTASGPTDGAGNPFRVLTETFLANLCPASETIRIFGPNSSASNPQFLELYQVNIMTSCVAYATIPEPSPWLLAATGGGCCAIAVRSRSKRTADARPEPIRP